MKVSIIIPVYNVSAYIERCIASVLRQSYQCIECIIVDDATEDDSIFICERLINGYQGSMQFKILHHTENRGLSAARNTGTFAATGDYIFYLDSDDEITDNCIEILLGGVENYPNVDLVQGNTASFPQHVDDSHTHNIIMTYASSNEEVRKCWYEIRQFGVTAWNKLVRRSFIMGNHIEFDEGVLYEDVLWHFYMLKYLSSAFFVEDVTYHYYQRSNSITTSIDIEAFGSHHYFIFQEILNHLTKEKELQELDYYSRSFAIFYPRYLSRNPKSKDLWHLFWKTSVKYRDIHIQLRLIACYLLGKFRYGWVIISCIKQLKGLKNSFKKSIGI